LTFSTRSLLNLPAVEWKSGAKYTCTASHSPSQSTVKRVIRNPKESPKGSSETRKSPLEIMESPEDYGTEEDQLENVNEDSNSSLSIMTFVILFIL
nr:RecName: Full=IgNAR transmembrane form NE [Ginglymostoma cirratum]